MVVTWKVTSLGTNLNCCGQNQESWNTWVLILKDGFVTLEDCNFVPLGLEARVWHHSQYSYPDYCACVTAPYRPVVA